MEELKMLDIAGLITVWETFKHKLWPNMNYYTRK